MQSYSSYRQIQFLNPRLHRSSYNSLVQPHFDYACIFWYPSVSQKLRKKIKVTQNKCLLKIWLTASYIGSKEIKETN